MPIDDVELRNDGPEDVVKSLISVFGEDAVQAASFRENEEFVYLRGKDSTPQDRRTVLVMFFKKKSSGKWVLESIGPGMTVLGILVSHGFHEPKKHVT